MSPFGVEFLVKLAAQQLLLYGHILIFALAVAEVLREDWRLLQMPQLDIAGLEAAARRLKWLLILLWATGIPLVGLALDWNFALLATKAKLMTKIIVVVALSVNGAVLHFLVLPMLKGRVGSTRLAATISCVVGAISTASWLYASFVGVARLVAPKMSMDHFMGLYVAVLFGAIATSLLFVRRHLEQVIADQRETAGLERFSEPTNGELLVLLRQLEHKILARDNASMVGANGI